MNMPRQPREPKNNQQFQSTKYSAVKAPIWTPSSPRTFKTKPESLSSKSKAIITRTQHGQTLKKDKATYYQFLNELFFEFSNTDDDLPRSIIYNDFKKLFKFAKLISEDSNAVLFNF